MRHRQARQSLRRGERAVDRSTPIDAAFATDPVSAFGGIIAFNRPVDAATLEAVAAQFVEVLIAPEYTADALSAIAQKKNVRVLEVPLPVAGARGDEWDLKRVGGGLLVQTPDARQIAVARSARRHARGADRGATAPTCCSRGASPGS